MASESALSATHEQEVYNAVPQEPQGPPQEEALRPLPPPPGALIPRRKFKWQPLAVAGSTVLSVLIILAVLLLPRHRPAAPRPPRPEVVAGAVQVNPPQMYINEEPPQAMPVPLRICILEDCLPVVPAMREGTRWISIDADAAAWWEVGTVVPYHVLLRQPGPLADVVVLALSSGREERFYPGNLPPTSPGLVVTTADGKEVQFAAAQDLDPNAVPTPQPTPTPMPTPTPPVPPEVVGAVADGDTIILRLRWNGGIPPQGAGAVCGGKEMPTVVSAFANGMVEIAIPHCSLPAIVDVGFVFAIE
jgi:hypothetical protein